MKSFFVLVALLLFSGVTKAEVESDVFKAYKNNSCFYTRGPIYSDKCGPSAFGPYPCINSELVDYSCNEVDGTIGGRQAYSVEVLCNGC